MDGPVCLLCDALVNNNDWIVEKCIHHMYIQDVVYTTCKLTLDTFHSPSGLSARTELLFGTYSPVEALVEV